MAHQQSSELLRVLGQLGDAAWAGTLLPLLTANKSAGAVALACKQLRQLCHGNQRQLKLTGANCEHRRPLALDAFTRCFPACSSVTFTASSTDDLGLHFACIVSLLARLSNLQSLQLTINSSAASQPAHVAPALQLLRLQLPQLRSLQLALGASWTSDSQQAWELLGAATQLTKLSIEFKNRAADGTGLSLQHLSALRPLGSSLQQLVLTAERISPRNPQDCSFLSSFSGLTRLLLPVINHRSGLAAIRSCTALQDLCITRPGGTALNAADCDALAQLTRLTYLDIPPSSDTSALLEALQCLSGLQVLALRDMSSSHLPALAALTQLTRLRGSWAAEAPEEPAAAAAAQASCPYVALVGMAGPFPMAAFPGAKEVVMHQAWLPSRLASLRQHMKSLKAIGIGHVNQDTFRSVEPSASVSERVAAVRSLGQLAQLTQLQFALNDDAEAAALGSVTQLQRLVLYAPRGSSVSMTGLSAALCRLGKLQVVILDVRGLQPPQPEAMSLLCGLSAVRWVKIVAASAEQGAVWKAAAAAAIETGLPLPANYIEHYRVA